MKSKSNNLTIPLILLTWLWLSANLLAQASDLINYSGVLTDSLGNPRNGTFDMTFTVYDSLAPSQGRELYRETINNVAVRNGEFNVLLGSTPTPPRVGDLLDVFGQSREERFLEIQVGTEPPLMPRQPIVSVTYSLKTAKLDSIRDTQIWDGKPTSPQALATVLDTAGNITMSRGTIQSDGGLRIQTGGSEPLVVASGGLQVNGPIQATGGIPIYRADPGCGGGLTTATTCQTLACGIAPTPLVSPLKFLNCGGDCSRVGSEGTCTTTLVGRLVAP